MREKRMEGWEKLIESEGLRGKALVEILDQQLDQTNRISFSDRYTLSSESSNDNSTLLKMLSMVRGSDEEKEFQKVPDWFVRFVHNSSSSELKELVDLKSGSNSISRDDITKLRKYFSVALEKSFHSLIVNAALDPEKTSDSEFFPRLFHIISRYGKEIRWNPTEVKKLNGLAQHKANSMPIVSKKSLFVRDEAFELYLRSENQKVAIQIVDSSGKIVFQDGPRSIYVQKLSGKLTLESSEIATVTEENRRQLGLYQKALETYKDYLTDEKQFYLQSENIETMEFYSYLSQALEIGELKRLLISRNEMREFATGLGFSLELLDKDDATEWVKFKDSLLILSLQGRARLKAGLSLRVADQRFGLFLSERLSDEQFNRRQKAVKILEDRWRESGDVSFLRLFFGPKYLNFLEKGRQKKENRVALIALQIPNSRSLINSCTSFFQRASGY